MIIIYKKDMIQMNQLNNKIYQVSNYYNLKQGQHFQMDIFKIEGHQVIFKATCKITSPLAASSELYYCVSENGDIYKISSQNSSLTGHKQTEVMFTILGCPSAIETFQINRGFLISDLAHQSIFLRDQQQVEKINNLITDYNQKAFHGPSSLALNDSNSYMFFTDSGAFGQTSIQNRTGSLFAYKFQDKSLKPLIYRELAYPCGVVLSPDEKFILVCQLGENRILKVVIDEAMTGNYTVFHQFSGRVGPSSICFFNGFFYVSLFEFAELDNTGVIAVLTEQGDLVQKISLPTGSEITSIKFVPPVLETNNQMICLVTEGNRLHEIKFRGEKLDLQSQSQGMIDVSGVHQK